MVVGMPTCTFCVLALLLVGSFAQDVDFKSPFSSDMSYQFFKVASSYLDSSSSALSTTVNAQCKRDIKRIYNGIESYQEWALEWPDSWGRLPVGLLWGHPKSYGAFRECMAASYPGSGEPLKGQYCLANVPIESFVKKIVDRNQVARVSFRKVNSTIFELGICVPASCKVSETNSILKAVLKNQYNVPDLIFNKYVMVPEGRCDIREPIKLRPIDIVAICFFVGIVVIMIVSSIYDYVQTQRRGHKRPLFIAFSVLTNAPKVFTVKKVNNPNIIHCLSGMRAFSMMWVIFGHGYITYYYLPAINFDNVYPWFQTPYSILVHNSTLCVDTFFFLSGLLVLWGAFREMDKTNGRLNIPMMYFHRYIRLTPVVAVVILYIMSLYKYSGDGPVWMKIGTQDERCANTWWANLLYIQNYVYPYTFCMSQTWYLAVDTQLYVLSPIVLIPLWKWGKKALPFACLLIVLCMACTFATYMVNEFTMFRVDDVQYDLRQAKTYYPTHTRVPSWLMGVVFGYLLYTVNRGKQFPLSRLWVIVGWGVCFGVMIACMWGPYLRRFPGSVPPAPIIEAAFYESLSRPAWNVAMGWVIWACYNGHGGIINDFLSWDFFTGISRLSYCMYVIHRIVQYVNFGRVQVDTTFDSYDFILRWWGDFGITLTISCFATLAFEVPILGIEKAIFGRGETKKADTLPVLEPKQVDSNPLEKNIQRTEI